MLYHPLSAANRILESTLPTLFSYVVVHDAGSAPNPFWGVCTLVLCKPAIRRTAQVGDWIVGTGSAQSDIDDVQGKVIYVMQVTDKMTMREYEAWAQEHRPEKVPDPRNHDPRRWVGDAVCDFSVDPPRKRPGPRDDSNRKTDLGGGYALLSEHFFYFGDRARELPEHLQEVVLRRQGHRSRKNAPYVEPFVDWLTGLGLQPNELYGDPPLLPTPSELVPLTRKP
jgi:hypothetical protein